MKDQERVGLYIHELRREQAEAFANFIAHQELPQHQVIDAEALRENSAYDSETIDRLARLVTARSTRRDASLLRWQAINNGATNEYTSWLSSDLIGSTAEAMIAGEKLPIEVEPLPNSILGTEKELDERRMQRLHILWRSGQNGGLGISEARIFDELIDRTNQLQKNTTVLFNELSRSIVAEDEAEARQRTILRALQKSRLIRSEHHKQAERDGIIHLPSTDARAEKFMPLVAAGKHLLFMGPRGTAKSAFSRYLANMATEFAGSERPVFATLKEAGKQVDAQEHIDDTIPEITLTPKTQESEIVGRWTLQNGDTIFAPGPLLQALERDVPFIIEEFNNAGHELQSVMQRVMLLKPGQPISFQHGDSTKVFTRGKNFCVIANANPNDGTYDRYNIDAAMLERFTGGDYYFGYPDQGIKYEDDPIENKMLLEIALTDKSGKVRSPNQNWGKEDLSKLASLAHRTQYLASHPAASVRNQHIKAFLGHDNFGTNKPVLANVVLSPRLALDLVARAQANPTLTLQDVLVDFAASPVLMSHHRERRVIAELMVQHNIILEEKVAEKMHIPDFKCVEVPEAEETDTAGDL